MAATIAVGAMVIFLVSVLAWMVIRHRRDEAARVAFLAHRGWRYERTGQGFVVEGGETVPWTLTVVRSRGSSSSSSTQTLWETPAEPTTAVVLLGPKLPAMAMNIDMGGMVVQMALRMILGDDAKDLADAREVTLGSAAFRERFSVLASSDELAASLVVPEIETALLESAFTDAAVLRWRDRLQVRITHGAWDPDEIASLVSLGETVADRCGYAEAD